MGEFLTLPDGSTFSRTDVRAACDILFDNTDGIMVRQPLARAGNPLANVPYVMFGKLQRAKHPADFLPGGKDYRTYKGRYGIQPERTRPAFLAFLLEQLNRTD